MIVAGLALPALASGVGAACSSAAPVEADVRHGKYLFQLGSCAGCHGQNLAGYKAGGPPEQPQSAPYGELFAGPFGSVPSRNITQDRDTGIGSWTDDQIAAAIRDGKTPDRGQLSPVMPYGHLHFLSDEDTRDLVAFLRTIPAVRNKVPDRQLQGPAPAPLQQPPAPATAPASGLARGAYLVDVVAGCGDCHTPRNPDGSPDMTRQLAGSAVPRTGGHFEIAPNITPDHDTGIGTWSEADIARLLKTGLVPEGVPVSGLMELVIRNDPWGGFNQLTGADAAAIAAYLKTIPPVSNTPHPPTANPPPAP
jgi:mono/diheme cytochrome c family protein